MKQLLINIEKKITKNQKLRMKFADEPEKFMESEIELHTEIQELYAIAASPELYPILIHTEALHSLLGLITHENTDISLAIINLFHEMTDVDTIIDELDHALLFINTLISSQGLELIIQNLNRLDTNASNEEDAQGIYNSLEIMENLIEIKPEVAVILCEKTHILKFLLERCKSKQFDANKLYSSEILSILLQSNVTNQILICNLQNIDGMDVLLQVT